MKLIVALLAFLLIAPATYAQSEIEAIVSRGGKVRVGGQEFSVSISLAKRYLDNVDKFRFNIIHDRQWNHTVLREDGRTNITFETHDGPDTKVEAWMVFDGTIFEATFSTNAHEPGCVSDTRFRFRSDQKIIVPFDCVQ